ncbi:hypothetical protein FWK35_00021834 [Aphis craccivora]|uniref:Uncharacterized protein n=1 Tax=Aphis craccivora TaxID=307492 RepID=A0A6G0YCT4_APHCR|nr:hypothetical protein FWK35_00021834 [Aphis craccivora]
MWNILYYGFTTCPICRQKVVTSTS